MCSAVRRCLTLLSASLLLLLPVATVALGGFLHEFKFFPEFPSLSETSLYLILEPGEEARALLKFTNVTEEPLSLHLYGANATMGGEKSLPLPSSMDSLLHRLQRWTGATTVSAERERTPGVGHWILLERDPLHLPPRSFEHVLLWIAVPPDTPPGEYRGGIGIEEWKASSQETPERKGHGTGQSLLSLSFRFAKEVRVFVVPPEQRSLLRTAVDAGDLPSFTSEIPFNLTERGMVLQTLLHILQLTGALLLGYAGFAWWTRRGDKGA